MALCISTILSHAAGLKPLPFWQDGTERRDSDRAFVQQCLADGARIYGFNTFTGHRDHDGVQPDAGMIGAEILRSHTLAGTGLSRYGSFAARLMGYAKISALHGGGSGVSPGLYDRLARLVTTPHFQPSVPRDASYSCGDVIPAACWTDAALAAIRQQDGFEAAAGDVMALMNGRFIQLGFAAALLPGLETAWRLHMSASSLTLRASGVPKGLVTASRDSRLAGVPPLLDFLADGLPDPSPGLDAPQSPVSLRAVPDMVEMHWAAQTAFAAEIERSFPLPSCNPWIDGPGQRIISQGSFLACQLTQRTGSLIEALLAAMLCSVRRQEYLLAGKIAGFPKDGATQGGLGYIQIPKLAAAILERGRANNAMRAFASNGVTSYGIEDFWSKGLIELAGLETLISQAQRIFALEAGLAREAVRHSAPSRTESNPLDGHSQIVAAVSGPDDPAWAAGVANSCPDVPHLLEISAAAFEQSGLS